MQRKEDSIKEARRKACLEEERGDIKNTTKDPSLKYVSKSQLGTKTLLENHRKEEILNELQKMEKNFGNHKDVGARINDRENCHLRLGYKENVGLTKGKIEEERKQNVISNLT